MDKDYVDYQTALALKECGFDEPCDHCYAKTSDSEHEFVGMATSRDYNKPRDRKPPFLSPICSAPLLYHTQKWLREVKGLYAYPEINALKKWFARVIDLNDNEELLMDGAMFNTYEEAQSHAIKCALQFIDNREI